ncbi:DUF479 domain-containing protein [Vibrio fluvialis]|nr:DUF479 domain-containing protein [Vibrio fluvialis]MBY7947960.1 DUF479 domain-containing protein [Vibrio fluvialis]MBY8011048.1 DUF479 domain-containing protein [Vibrio fluvialis]MBY8016228.1 DUF479 domain-containing protein [Vibrio fluvialis]MBY8179605.1 DUF479 domain-containing protein [Vibrio fluvialis]
MNYLAHLHIADHCQSSLLGNLLGDFVKGDPSAQFSPEIARGIRLHRLVDVYTDSHPVMQQAKAYFSSQTRRFAPIALDMFWDHCLAKEWRLYHDLSLRAFVNGAQRQVQQAYPAQLPERFTRVSKHMWQGRWLESYADFDNIEFALQRMSQRSARMATLAYCFDSMNKHYQPLRQLFSSLYPDVLEKAKRAEV